MKMKRNTWFFILLLVVLSPGIFPGESTGGTPAVTPEAPGVVDVLEEKQLLETELQLAKTSGLYVFIDLRNKRIELRARGMVLREWPVEFLRFRGHPVPLTALVLKKKSALFPPKREDIKPGRSKDNKDYKPDILEVEDMPSGYALYIDEGIRMYVRPKSRGFFPALLNFGRTIKWFTVPPLVTVWYSLSGKSFTAVDIVLTDSRETRSLYWTFTEGTPCIILPPKNLSMPPQ
jgi:hypothetical protein